MTIRALTIAFTGGLLFQAGCDAKAGDHYQGEPLLSFQGDVRLHSTQIQGELVPAIAFVPRLEELQILDVQVSGSFPANFTLDVLQPPPAAALTSARRYIWEAPRDQKIALGYITAVGADHPSVIKMATHFSHRYTCEGGVTNTMPSSFDSGRFRADPEEHIQLQRMWHRGQPGSVCTEEIGATNHDPYEGIDEKLYSHVATCDHEFKSCQVSSQGDPKYLRSPFKSVAGLSSNYFVLYLPEAAAQGTAVARAFGGNALAAGYHLLKAEGELEQPELYDACYQSVDVVALYNAKHGTSYATEDALALGVLPPYPGNPGSPETLDPETYDYAAFDRAAFQMHRELDDLRSAELAARCSEHQPVLARPIDPAGQTISIQVEASFEPALHLTPNQI